MDTAKQEAFEERAAIMEYCGGLPRARAEALALLEMMPAEKKTSPGYAAFREAWQKNRRKYDNG